jgi:hypothetical protein
MMTPDVLRENRSNRLSGIHAGRVSLLAGPPGPLLDDIGEFLEKSKASGAVTVGDANSRRRK